MSYSNTKDLAIVVSGKATGTGVVASMSIDLSNSNRMVDSYTFVCKGKGGAPTAFAASVEVSLDGTNWTSILDVTQADDSAVKNVVGKLTQMVRVNVTDMTTLAPATEVDFNLIAS